MRITSLGLRTDVALRVLEGAEVADRGDYLVVRSPDNPGFWWGNFLLLGVLPPPGAAGAWLDRFAAEFPAAQHLALAVDTAGPVESADPTDTSAGDPVTPAEFLAAGLEAEYSTVLTCSAVRPPPHPNAEAQIRPLETDADWQQSFELGIRSFGDDGAQEYIQRRAAARRRLTQAGKGAWFGAFADGRLLAQLGIFDVGDGFARYQHVETDPAARRRGLAGTLVWHAGRYACEVLAASTLVIVADPVQEAIRVYHACGFTDRERYLAFERGPVG